VSLWNDADGNLCKKYFSSNKYGIAEAWAMAIEHCQRMIRSLPHYVEALGFESSYWTYFHCPGATLKGQQKIKIFRTNRQSNLRGSCQSIFSLSWHHPSAPGQLK